MSKGCQGGSGLPSHSSGYCVTPSLHEHWVHLQSFPQESPGLPLLEPWSLENVKFIQQIDGKLVVRNGPREKLLGKTFPYQSSPGSHPVSYISVSYQGLND